MALTIEEALDIAGVRARHNKIMCPRGHDRKAPSLQLYEDSCYCFGCGFTGDAYGLLAALLDQPVATILRRYGEGRLVATDTTKELSPYKLRTEAHWLPIEASQPLFRAIRGAHIAQWKRELLLAEASDWYEDKRAELEGLAPFEVERRLRSWPTEIRKWLDERQIT